MRPNSEKCRSINLQLYELQRAGLSGARKYVSETSVDLIRQLVELNEWGSIPILLRCLFATDQAVRTAADHALHHVVISLEPSDFLRDRLIAESWDIDTSAAPDQPQVGKLPAFVARFESRPAIMGLLSCHYNGYIRQEAVRLLAEIDEGIEFPFLLIRQNDWVDSICVEARNAVRTRIKADNLPALLRYMPLILHLRKLSRRDHSDIVQQVVEILMRPENESVLVELLHSEDRDIRRAIARLALDLKSSSPTRLIDEGLASTDAVVRFWCACRVRKTLPIQNQDSIIEVLQTDRYMPVRREGFSLESDVYPERSVAVWKRALLDQHASIRELARYHLRPLPGFQVAAYYREIITERGPSKAAICGLEEAGDRSDLPLLRDIIQSGSAGLRRAAVRALAAVGKEDVMLELLSYLCEKDAGVAKEAGRSLSPFWENLSGQMLLDVVMNGQFNHSRYAALALIFQMGKWASLPWLIRAAGHPDQSIAVKSQTYLESWFAPPLCNRIFTTPSRAERVAIEESILTTRSSIPNLFLQKLRDQIKPWW